MPADPVSLPSPRYPSLAAGATCAGRWIVIALGFSIPISVALDNVLLAATALMWLAAGDLRAKLGIIRNNPVALAACVLFGLFTLGLAWGTRTPGDGLRYLGKYADLLFVPLFMVFFADAKTRERALYAFALAALASVIASHLAYFNLLTDNPLLPRRPDYPVGFKFSLTHNLIVAFAAFLFALFAREETARKRRWCLGALAAFAAHNVVFMVLGRTGYLVLALLFVYFFVVTCGRRGLPLIAVIVATTMAAAYVTSSTFRSRADVTASQLRQWQPGTPSADSVGMRLEFYSMSLGIIRENPLLGTGTGSFPTVYASAAAQRNMAGTDNPHNEYLLITVQLGLTGLACLLYLFFRQWQFAGRLEQTLYRDLARGLVLTFAVGCLFNSLLVDHTEGLLFAWLSALVFAASVKRPEAPGPAP